MKILYVGHTYTVRANHAKIAALARLPGVHVTLVTPQGWRGPLYNNVTDEFHGAPNIDHRILPAAFIGKESGYFFGPSIFALIARLKPDVVHVEQGAWAMSYAQVLLATKLFSQRSRALFFTWWNLPYSPSGLKRWLQRFNLSNSDGAVAGNEDAKRILESQGFDKPIRILPQLGIDLPEAVDAGARETDRFTIGYAGRITEEKGVLDLVEAAAQMKNREKASLYFVGAGPALNDVKRLAAVRGIQLKHHPAVRNEELHEHLKRMDVLVLPSRSTPEWVEQFGHILLEAMAVGVPVIGSSSGEIPNVIGDAGIVFPEGDSAALTTALDALCENEPLRIQLADKAIERVRQSFTHDIIAQRQFQFYCALLAMKPANKEREMIAAL